MNVDEMDKMSTSELASFLVEEMNISPEDNRELQGERFLIKAHLLPSFTDRNIDGHSFTQLTREDFSLIFPSKEKFLLGSKLYKLAQQIRMKGTRVVA